MSDPSDSSQVNNFQKTRRQVALHHTDIIGDTFWNEHGDILDSWHNHGYDSQTASASVINAHINTC